MPKSILQTYKVCLLQSNGNPDKMYVYGENNFTVEEQKQLTERGIELIQSDQFIHPDDTIASIKMKIINDIGIGQISYEELYLFIKTRETVPFIEVYDSITQNEGYTNNAFTVSHLIQYLKNTDTDKTEIINILNQLNIFTMDDSLLDKMELQYNQLIQIPQLNRNEFSRFMPFGQQPQVTDYIYAANPFFLSVSAINVGIQPKFGFTLDNQLLLNYRVDDNIIYVATPTNVFEYSENKQFQDIPYLIQSYFPLLYKEGITTKAEFEDNNLYLIDNTRKKWDQPIQSYNKSIDFFYNIQSNHGTHEIEYSQNGISHIEFELKSNMDIKLPLEIIFKIIHATKEMPFVKFNPGSKRENIYRLYTEQKTRDGKNIPTLSEQTITKLSKELGKPGNISIRVQLQTDSTLISNTPAELNKMLAADGFWFTLNMDRSGDITIETDFKIPVDTTMLNLVFVHFMNPILKVLNQSFTQSGYQLPIITDITDEKRIRILSLKYVLETDLIQKWDVEAYNGCISCVFDVVKDDNTSNITVLRYKRVEHFRDMDAQTIFITETINRTNNDEEMVVEGLMTNYNMNEETANKRLLNYLQNYKDVQGKIVDNPGFTILMKSLSIDNKLNIEIHDVISLKYLEPLYVYFDTLIRLSQYKNTITLSKEEVKSACKKDKKSSVVVDNVVKVKEEMVQAISYKFDDDEDDEDELNNNKTIIEPVEYESKTNAENDLDEDNSDEEGIIFDNAYPNEDDSEEDDEDEYEYQDGGVKLNGTHSNDEKETEEEDDDEQKNTEPSDKRIFSNPTGKLKHPTLFFDTMKKRDPALFEATVSSTYKGYARSCAVNLRRQPIMLNKKEYEYIKKHHRDSYTEAATYGSDPANPNYFICPRYWCFLTNTSMTEEDVKQGKCEGKGRPDKIIPHDAPTIPRDAFVYEFNNETQHREGSGTDYLMNTPGYITDKHPEGLGLPCCFKKSRVEWDRFDMGEKEDNTKTDGVQNNKKMNKDTLVNNELNENETRRYIIRPETLPIDNRRFGFLPIEIQRFLQTKHSDSVTESNPALIRLNTPCLLRKGVEQVRRQSILGSIAELYAYSQRLPAPPTVEELKQIMTSVITLDKFIKYNNGYLVSAFKPKKVYADTINIDEYADSIFYKSIDMSNDFQIDFLEDTIASYQNFIKYLNSTTSEIDHTYLWDIVTDDYDQFIKGGVNLVIMEIENKDITSDIKILCPTNSSSDIIYNKDRQVFLLIKKEDIFEPICLYKEETAGTIEYTLLFDTRSQTTLAPIYNTMRIIQSVSNKKCGLNPSISTKIYKFKQNINLIQLTVELTKLQYTYKYQVMNYQGKIIGVVAVSPRTKNSVFVPCLPSVPDKILEYIPIKRMDDDDDLWNDYKTTFSELTELSELSNGNILSKPSVAIKEDAVIVGILTETNQFVQLNPPSEDIFHDIPVHNNSNYNIADKIITTSRKTDMKRVSGVQNIMLETQFYTQFRTEIRNQLATPEARVYVERIHQIIDYTKWTYNQKLTAMIQLIKLLVGHKIVFNDFDKGVLNKLKQLNCMADECNTQSFCISKENGVCEMVIPKRHLISGADNEKVYYARVADELLRFRRIRLVMLKSKKYFNIIDDEYKLNDNEFILIQTSLNNDYLKNLIPVNRNKDVQTVSYYHAHPQITELYSSETVKLEDQIEKNKVRQQLNENVLACIDKTIEIVGNKFHSIWKQSFPTKCKEIVFRTTSLSCSFYPLIYIFQKTHNNIVTSIHDIKGAIWSGYKPHYSNYRTNILNILRKQGKQDLVDKIENTELTLETAIMSEEYYVTDLDICVFTMITKLQTCLFSSYALRGFQENQSWYVCGNNYEAPHFFIRTSPTNAKNALFTYHVIDTALKRNELEEPFLKTFQNAISGAPEEKNGLMPITELFELNK